MRRSKWFGAVGQLQVARLFHATNFDSTSLPNRKRERERAFFDGKLVQTCTSKWLSRFDIAEIAFKSLKLALASFFLFATNAKSPQAHYGDADD